MASRLSCSDKCQVTCRPPRRPLVLSVAFPSSLSPPAHRRRPSFSSHRLFMLSPRLPGMPDTNPPLPSRFACSVFLPAAIMLKAMSLPHAVSFISTPPRHLWPMHSVRRWSNLHVNLLRRVYAHWCVRSLAMLGKVRASLG